MTSEPEGVFKSLALLRDKICTLPREVEKV